ncbi:MAG: hypothetical protein IJN11_09735 [Oscillospiraceae bacterium]|nr:hypothetical protein [Oscillospiraceae bacterium]
MWLTQKQLWTLRQQIVLGSYYCSDYINTFGIDLHSVCTFFDGFLSFAEELMKEEIPDFNDANFFDVLPAYDNAERLWDWYGCFEENPLPLPEAEEEDEAA